MYIYIYVRIYIYVYTYVDVKIYMFRQKPTKLRTQIYMDLNYIDPESKSVKLLLQVIKAIITHTYIKAIITPMWSGASSGENGMFWPGDIHLGSNFEGRHSLGWTSLYSSDQTQRRGMGADSSIWHWWNSYIQLDPDQTRFDHGASRANFYEQCQR